MRSTLFFLLSLVGTALASHDVCFYYSPGDPAGDIGVVVVQDSSGYLLSQTKLFSPFTWVYEFENPRGFIHVEKKRGFSATFDGFAWGFFHFQIVNEPGKGKVISYGCHDTTKEGFCNDFDFKRKQCAARFKDRKD